MYILIFLLLSCFYRVFSCILKNKFLVSELFTYHSLLLSKKFHSLAFRQNQPYICRRIVILSLGLLFSFFLSSAFVSIFLITDKQNSLLKKVEKNGERQYRKELWTLKSYKRNNKEYPWFLSFLFSLE